MSAKIAQKFLRYRRTGSDEGVDKVQQLVCVMLNPEMQFA